MGGLQSEPTNGPIGDSLFLIVEVAGKIAPSILARWIYDRVVQYDAKRKAINGREVVNEADFHRVVTEELEIGKND